MSIIRLLRNATRSLATSCWRQELKEALFGRPRKHKRKKHASRRAGFESLEERAVFVVGALDLLPGVGDDQYTGVVRLGGTSLTATNPTCSATLLETGRHLLTAGHCIV